MCLPNGCPVNVSPNDLSAGTVLCIIFFICVSTYFVVGILYKKAVESASGIDLLPHTSFWTSLPGLIKDGYLFFISPCLGDRRVKTSKIIKSPLEMVKRVENP
ncbi:hypothetical protein KUTeg_001283 [Tegillarca granosa]|uniref:Uncharacterized protein n=1 Tax=Tegillarca granosa TaxID=220873 RepID=A0ABQ9FV82_TEGGR|nr:hypothetical protein KUTeg_001283 [Tegillarca granosa]